VDPWTRGPADLRNGGPVDPWTGGSAERRDSSGVRSKNPGIGIPGLGGGARWCDKGLICGDRLHTVASMRHPWNNWFHCTGSTFGTWLPGDPRGWRSREHRRHVAGDYKDPPPPGTYDELLAQSARSMKRKPVFITCPGRAAACREMARTLLRHDVELIDLAVGAIHWHLLARFTPLGDEADSEELKRTARRLVGIAKKNSSRMLTDSGLVPRGGAWAVRGGIHPIHDRPHQLRVVNYIREHAHDGAAIWSQLSQCDSDHDCTNGNR